MKYIEIIKFQKYPFFIDKIDNLLYYLHNLNKDFLLYTKKHYNERSNFVKCLNIKVE